MEGDYLLRHKWQDVLIRRVKQLEEIPNHTHRLGTTQHVDYMISASRKGYGIVGPNHLSLCITNQSLILLTRVSNMPTV